MVAMEPGAQRIANRPRYYHLTPNEFERDRHIPGNMVARPAWKEGKVLYECP